jgi:hypothetical protein
VADKGLDGWIGRRVTVQLDEEEPNRFSCTLESADERGIVVSYQRRGIPGRNVASTLGTTSDTSTWRTRRRVLGREQEGAQRPWWRRMFGR